MARGRYLLSLVLMLFLLSRILAQNRPESYNEEVLEDTEELRETREERGERIEGFGWMRPKRSIHGMWFLHLGFTKEIPCWVTEEKKD